MSSPKKIAVNENLFFYGKVVPVLRQMSQEITPLNKAFVGEIPWSSLFLCTFLLMDSLTWDLGRIQRNKRHQVISSFSADMKNGGQEWGELPKDKWGTRQKCGWRVGEGYRGWWEREFQLQWRALWATRKLIPELPRKPVTEQRADTGVHDTKQVKKILLCYWPLLVFPWISDALPLPLSVTELMIPLQHQPHYFLWGPSPVFAISPQSCPLSPVFLHWVLMLSSPYPCSPIRQQWSPLNTKPEILVLQKSIHIRTWVCF